LRIVFKYGLLFLCLIIQTAIFADGTFHEITDFPNEALTRVYERIVADLQEGRPLVVTSYLAACPAHIYGNGTLENNLYWDFMYGHKTMFDRSHRNNHIKSISPNTKWERVTEIIETCNRAYRYFQRLGGNDPGRLFVGYTE